MGDWYRRYPFDRSWQDSLSNVKVNYCEWTPHLLSYSHVIDLVCFLQPIQQMHRDHVPYVPPGFLLLGSSPAAPVQGLIRLYPNSPPSATSVPSSTATPRSETDFDAAADAAKPGRIHIFTVQGHPEFTGEIVNAIIDAREHSGVMSADAVRQGREHAFRNHEGIGAIGRAIWRVLGVNAPPAPA